MDSSAIIWYSSSKYRVILVVLHLRWVDFRFEMFPGLMGRYCSYLLPKQDAVQSNCMITRPTLY